MDVSRKHRLLDTADPEAAQWVTADRAFWYETPEEIEAGLEWGRQKAVLLRWVRRQMGRCLTLRERRCVELYFFRGLTLREAGAATGTNASSVLRALRRSLRKLRRTAKTCPPKAACMKARLHARPARSDLDTGAPLEN